MRRIALFALGPAVAIAIRAIPFAGLEGPAHNALAVTAWMALWWITEAVPISVTALLPLALFPFLGIIGARDVSATYGNEAIYLFLGGMLLAQSMERSNLHRRVALSVIRFTGSTSHGLVLGFMVATAGISMWVSNTATTVMILPVALATLKTLIPNGNGDGSKSVAAKGADVHRSRFAKALLLGVAYSANVGGMGTLVGTAPNLVFAGMVERLFPDAPAITFFDWMKVGVPVVVVLVPLMWLILTRWVWRWDDKVLGLERSHIETEIRTLGSLRKAEAMTIAVFSSAAFLWIFRSDIQLDLFTIPGWSGLFGNPAFLRDSTVAIAAAITLFLLPVNLKKGEFLLAGDWYKKVPWDVLLLLGGGFALASGFQQTGLSEWLAQQLGGLGGVSLLVLVVIVAASVSLFTEVASNTATATVLIPILGATAVAFGIHPFALMIPCTLAASCAFMLPAATPPKRHCLLLRPPARARHAQKRHRHRHRRGAADRRAGVCNPAVGAGDVTRERAAVGELVLLKNLEGAVLPTFDADLCA